jgi:replicative DNA helicase
MNPNIRELPASVEDERLILGGIMTDPTLMQEVAAVLSPVDFFSPYHSTLFRLFCDMHARQESVHMGVVFSVVGAMTPEKQSEIGGFPYVIQLPGHCPSVEAVMAVSKRTKKKAVQRQTIMASLALIQQAQDDSVDTHTLLSSIESMALTVSQASPTADWTSLQVALDEAMTDTMNRRDALTAGDPVGVSTGLRCLDALTGPMEPGQLWIVAGRPAMGKSALALQIAIATATAGWGVAMVSMEMSRRELAKRQLASNSGVFGDKIRDGRVTDYDLQAMEQAYQWLSGLPVWIQDDTSAPIGLLKAKTKRLSIQAQKQGNPLKLLVVDYLQLIEGQKGLPREQAVSMVSRSLKALAMDLEITVIGVSQLNRDCENRPDKRPAMADLRESGAIEQDANKILFVYRDEVYNPGVNAGKAEIIVAKNREGTSAVTAHVAWSGPTTTFKEA